LKLFVTGATGFLGKAVVAAAVAHGHHVRVLVRPAAKAIPAWWQENPLVEIANGDLRIQASISPALKGIDTVVHLAATKSGDLYEQFAGTVIATENLVNEMEVQDIRRIVLCSTFSVYECLKRWSWSLLDENSPLVREPRQRDEYSQTKLVQESLVRETAEAHGWSCIVLRPGVIFGRDNLWTSWIGEKLSDRCWVRTGTFAPVPLTYVENCAEAFVKAVEYSGVERELILNVVDNETPSQRAYMNAVHSVTKSRAWIIPMPWCILRFLARSAWLTNKVCFGGTGKLPGLLRPAALHARCKPLRYTNKKLRRILGWSPQFSVNEGLIRSVAPESDGI
jgi:2-alkyl-3-oxoalkanoate reductase